jgi:hypothetical protein
MERVCTLRSLRMAFSAVCGIICMLLIALWVRSYRVDDVLYGPFGEPIYRSTGAKSFLVESTSGHIIFCTGPFSTHHRNSWPWGLKSNWGVIHESHVDVVIGQFIKLPPVSGHSDFYLASKLGFRVAIFPHWVLVVLSAALAIALFGRWPARFSLRTLFTVTTLIAIVLGLVVLSGR